MNRRISMFACALLGLIPALSGAHGIGTSYLRITEPNDVGASVDVQVDLALRDLEFAVGLDVDGNGQITWRELQEQSARIDAYVVRTLHVRRGEPCLLSLRDLMVDEHADGPYAVLMMQAQCRASGTLQVRSDLLYELDLGHRTLLNAVRDGRSAVSVLTESQREWQPQARGVLRSFVAFFTQGVWHIWTGYDHLAFLLLLLMPAVVATGGLQAREAFARVLRIVTAFTLAHSITLASAVLGLVHFNSRVVESTIAMSIVIAGLANLSARTRHLGVSTAFLFGLVHGLGFASALQGLGLESTGRLIPLAGFNLGVEAGQLAIVLAALPLLVWICKWDLNVYLRRVLPAASLSVSALGLAWFVQRAFA